MMSRALKRGGTSKRPSEGSDDDILTLATLPSDLVRQIIQCSNDGAEESKLASHYFLPHFSISLLHFPKYSAIVIFCCEAKR